MDRGRPASTYRPASDRYAPGPRRGRTPPGERPYPPRGGTYRGPSPRRPSPGWQPREPRYRSRSPYRPRDGSSFRPRSPPRGPARGRSPLPQRYSRSPPPRNSPLPRGSPMPRNSPIPRGSPYPRGPLTRRPSPYRPPRSPPSRPRSPPSRPRSPPRKPASPPILRSPPRDSYPHRDRPPRRSSPPPQPVRERSPPPRVRDEEPRAPPSGPRVLQHDSARASQHDNAPRDGMNSVPTGPASFSQRPAYPTGPSRGRGSLPFGRGRGDTYLSPAPAPFGRGRGGFDSTSRRGGFDGGPPTGPRSSYAEAGPPTPNRFIPDRPSFRSNNITTGTYPRTQRFNPHLASLPQLVDGGRKLPSGLDPLDERRLAQLETDKERLYKEIDEKQKKKRAVQREYDKAERDAETARLRSDLAESQLEDLAGDVTMGDAY